MKIRTVLAIAFLCVLVLPSSVALAQEPITTTSTEDLSSEVQERVKKLRSNVSAEVNDRIAGYKESLKTRLTAAEEARLKTRCKSAQGIVAKLTGRGQSLEENRTKVYSVFSDRLTTLAERLDAGGEAALATEVRATQATLQEKTDAVIAAVQDYRQALSDVEAVSCESDPTAFKAALENARTLRAAVAAKAADVRSYKNETVTKLLATIKQQLGAGQAAPETSN